MSDATRVKQIKGDTVGSVLFIGAGGHATEKNSNLFWDNTNNYLGIGTDLPNEKLEITGNLRFTNGADRIISITDVTSGNGDSLTIQAGGSSASSVFAGSIAIKAGSATNLSTGGNIFLDGGNGQSATASGNILIGTFASNTSLGIREDNPLAPLHVTISRGVTPTISAETSALFQNSLVTTSNSQISIIGGTAAASRIYFGTISSEVNGIISYNNVTDVMTLSTNGTNVGPSIDENGNINTEGTSLSTRYDNVTIDTTVIVGVNVDFILARASASRGASTLTYQLPQVNSAGIKDGHRIKIRTLDLPSGNVDLFTNLVGTPPQIRLLTGADTSSYSLSANSSYELIYQSGLNRYVEV